MAVTAALFRQNFPAFASAVQYPDGSINFWLNYAYMLLPACRWKNILDLGVQLFVAHNVTLDGLGAAEGQNGAPSGMTVGPVVSKTVGDLTITYDTASGVSEGDQHWSLTNYGTRFVKLARQFGSGPVQIGIGYTPVGQGYGQPWPGPRVDSYNSD